MNKIARSQRPLSLSEFLSGLELQGHVIGALILRELHTRFGRNNIGFLWFLAEPLMLAAAVAAMHTGAHANTNIDVQPVALGLIGYVGFMLFRSIVSRAESTLHSNQPLLYHRAVTIFDMLLARAVLDFAATISAMALLLAGGWLAGLWDLPARPLSMLIAMLLMLWWSFALSLLICSACHASALVERLLHPVIYLMMPLSGGFFVLKWIPDPYRTWLWWFPMVQIFELLRFGNFRSLDDRYVDMPYIIGSCLVLTFLGLASIRITRRHVHLS